MMVWNESFEYRNQWRAVVYSLIHFLVLENARNFLATWLTVDSQNVIQSLLVSYFVTYLLCTYLFPYFDTYLICTYLFPYFDT
jgi:hypothetical protein